MDLFIQTVVTKERLYSKEFINFIEYFNGRGIGVFVSFAKPVGAWERRYEGCIDNNSREVQGSDLYYFRQLEQKYRLFSHLTPGYGLDMGCIAVKGMATAILTLKWIFHHSTLQMFSSFLLHRELCNFALV